MPRYYRKRRYVKKRQSLTKKVNKLTKIIGKQETQANVFSNYNGTDGNLIPSAAIDITPLRMSNIEVGAEDIFPNRKGNKVQVRRLFHKATFSNTNDGPGSLRTIFFYWKGTSPPILSDILQIMPAGTGVPDIALSPINPVSVCNGYLNVLKDEVHILENDQFGVNRFKTYNWEWKYPTGKIQLYEDDDAASQTKGFYYLHYSNVEGIYCQDLNITYFKDN